jgi:hypothetical protein
MLRRKTIELKGQTVDVSFGNYYLYLVTKGTIVFGDEKRNDDCTGHVFAPIFNYKSFRGMKIINIVLIFISNLPEPVRETL